MKYALREAEKAYSLNEVPVGCIIVFGDSIIAKAYNEIEILKDPTLIAKYSQLLQQRNTCSRNS